MLESLFGFCKIIVLAAALAAAFPYYFTLAFSFPLFSSQGTGSFPFEKALGLPPRKAFLAASRFLPRPLVPVSGLRSPRRTPAQPVGSMRTSPLERLRSRFPLSGISALFAASLRRWWAQVDSNHRPHAYQACALTT